MAKKKTEMILIYKIRIERKDIPTDLMEIKCKWVLWKSKSLSHVQLFVTPWTIQSMESSRP